MKRNVIAVLLSISLVAGSFGAAPLYAAEVTAQETEQDIEEKDEESEESIYDLAEDSEEAEPSSPDHDNNDVDENNQNSDEGSSDEEGALPVHDEIGENEEDSISEEDSTNQEGSLPGDGTDNKINDEETAEVQETATIEEEQSDDKTLSESNSNDTASTNVSSVLVASGNCGRNGGNLVWTVYDDGVLEISGTGEMADYSRYSSPWKSLRNQITEIMVCDGVTSIGNYAFYELESTTKLTVAESLTSVGDGAFTYCHINSVYFDGSLSQWVNKYAFTLYYVYQLYVKDNQEYSLVTDLSGLEGIDSIPERAFCKCSSLTSATLPDGVTSIGVNAFSGCRWITEIGLPDGLLEIENSAFADCDGFESIELPDTLTMIGGGAFEGCKRLQDISIPESCTYLGDQVFRDCTSLTSIEFPKNIEFDGEPKYLISGCSGLKEIRGYNGSEAYICFGMNITASTKYKWISLGQVTSGRCGDSIQWNLNNGILRLDGSGEMYNGSIWNGFSIDYVIIPDGVTYIGNYAFSALDLETVSIPNSVLDIGKGALAGCRNLQTVVLPESLSSISEELFTGCTELQIIHLPESVQTIGSRAFDGCEKLISIDWPDSLQTINESAFANCTKLQSIEFPDSVSSIANYAFSSCRNLERVVFPDSVASVGYNCFSYCTKLTTIEIPKSIRIGSNLFIGTNLTSVYFRGTCDEFVTSNLTAYDLRKSNNIKDDRGIYCLDDNGEYYLMENISLSDGITIIPSGKFEGYSPLKSIILPSTLKRIDEAFSYCDGLTYIDVPEGTEELNYSFYGCDNLSRIKLPSTLRYIESNTFNSDVTLIVYENTYAHTYAVENNFNYEINTEEIKANSVTLSEEEIIIEKNESKQLTAEILPTSTINKNLTWTSSDNSIVYVTNSGVAVGLKEGTATITVTTSNGKTDSCEVTVLNVIPLTGISLPETAEIPYGTEYISEIVFEPTNTTDDKTTSWESSDSDVFTVSEEGVVTPTGIGTATLTATVGEFSATSEITVVKGTPEYVTPEMVNGKCGQTLEELELPDGFEWENPGENVGNAGTNQHEVIYVPEDSEHYSTVGDIIVVVDVTHNFSEEWTQSPDLHWHECVCGERSDEDGHIFGDWMITVEPTCSELGEKETTCSECGYVEHETIDATGHNWYSDYTVDVEATCTESGEKSIYCKTCGEKNEDSTVEIPALGHVYAEKVIQPTCSQGGFTMHICGRCGDYYEDNETQPTGHSFGDWIIDNDSTCTEEGIQHRECADCGYIETKGINKKDHSFDTEFTVDKEPTCTTDGSRSYHCTSEGCTATTGSEVIPATGHDYSDWTVTREATCTESGEMQRTCAVCDETEIVEYGARGHVWLKTYTVDQEATCTEEGSESIRCAVCDEVKEGSEQVIPAAGHAMSHVEAVPATYESEGNIEYYRCETCGKIYSDESCEQELSEDETVIPKMDRIPVKIVTHPADVEAAADEQVTFSVVAEGSDLSYQWQLSSNGTSWSNCKGAGFDTDIFSFVMNKKYAGRRYRCIVTSGEETVTSDAAVLSYKENNKITGQPEDVNAAVDETVAFHVEATGKDLSYQWQYSVNGTYWGNCTGSSYNTDTFSFKMQERFDGRKYRCVVTADGNTLISNAAAVHLKQAGEIVEQPQDRTAGVGDEVSFHVGFSGNDPEYQWQYSLNGSYWSNCKGSSYDSDTFSFVMQEKFDGRRYRCVIKAGGMTYTSDSVTVRLAGNEMITSQPEDMILAAGGTASFHVGTSESGLTYQWQWSADGSTWKNCTGAGFDSDTFSFTAQTKYSGRSYRCMVTDGTKTEYSDSGLLTVTK